MEQNSKPAENLATGNGEYARFRLLNGNKFVVVSEFNGNLYIHVREYQADLSTNKLFPTKKGISFTPSIFANFVQNVDEINKNVLQLKSDKQFEFRVHLGRAWFASVTSGYNFVNLRKYFLLDGKLHPTKTGLCLKMDEWACLMGLIDAIKSSSPIISGAVPCYLQSDHSNQDGAHRCSNCYPFGIETSYS